MKFYTAEVLIVDDNDIDPEEVMSKINTSNGNLRVHITKLQREEKSFNINMIDTNVETLFSTDKSLEYVLIPVKPTIDIIKILLEEVPVNQNLRAAKDKYETIVKRIGISVIAVDVAHECVELRKENKILKARLNSIRSRILEIL
jgi:hypothetical protein